MLKVAGFENQVKQDRYPELTVKEIKDLAPKVVLLSSEPYPFKDKHIEELKAELPNV
jgi:hypothetical protein